MWVEGDIKWYAPKKFFLLLKIVLKFLNFISMYRSKNLKKVKIFLYKINKR